MKRFFLAAACALAASVLAAQGSEPASGSGQAEPATEVYVTVDGGGLVTMTSATKALTPIVRIAVVAPIPIGNSGRSPLDFEGSVELSALPGEDLETSQPATWKAAGTELGLKVKIGQSKGGTISTYLKAHWGFKSVLPVEGATPKPRLARRYGVSIKLESKGGDYVQAGIGHDEATDSDADDDVEKPFWSRLQYLIEARVSLPMTAGIGAIVARASLTMGPTFAGSGKDIYEIGLAANAAQAIKVIRGKK